MEITDAKVKLVSDKADKLKAFCTITIDGEFVIRDIKVIKGTRACFIAMPSRKLMDRCPSCGGKNHLRTAYCNDCGGTLRENRVSHDAEGRAKLHADTAHPINSACRERLQKRIIEAYEAELEQSQEPGYVPASEDAFEDDTDSYEESHEPAARPEPIAAHDPPVAEPPPVEEVGPPPATPEPPAETDAFGSGIL